MKRICVIIAYRNTPDMVESQIAEIKLMARKIPSLKVDFVIVNMGYHPHYFDTIHAYEKEFRGKLYGHWLGLKSITDINSYDYYWFNHPDISFATDMYALQTLLDVMENNPDIGLISPVQNPPHWFPDMYKKGHSWHHVGVVNYISYLIRREALSEVGFMDAETFKYVRGAPIEYCYRLWKHGWAVVYCDIAKIHHFGGTTYTGKDTISREEYLRKAIEFERNYFVSKYGNNWDKEFAKVLPDSAWKGIYTFHRRGWENWELARVIRKIFNNKVISRLIGGKI